MKKVILKVFGVAALAVGVMFNAQVFDIENGSEVSLAALGNVAIAQNEGDVGVPGAWFWKKIYHDIECSEVRWQKTTFYGANGSILGSTEYVNSQLIVQYSGTYTSAITESGTSGSYSTKGWGCYDGWDDLTCTSCPNPCIGC